MAKKLWSLSGLAEETGRNFRTLAKAMANVKPDGKAPDGGRRWYMATAVAALERHVAQTGRVPEKTVERFDPVLERQILEIELTGAEMDKLLARLRAEQSIERRRALIEGGAGKCVGAHERALTATIGTGSSAPLRQVFIDEMLRPVLAEVAALCEWRIEAEPRP
jgi:hypothetical protein